MGERTRVREESEFAAVCDMFYIFVLLNVIVNFNLIYFLFIWEILIFR